MIEEGKAYKRVTPHDDKYPRVYFYVDKIYFRQTLDDSNFVNRIRFVGFSKTVPIHEDVLYHPNFETIEITYPLKDGYLYEEISMSRFLSVVTGGRDADYPISADQLEYQ